MSFISYLPSLSVVAVAIGAGRCCWSWMASCRGKPYPWPRALERRRHRHTTLPRLHQAYFHALDRLAVLIGHRAGDAPFGGGVLGVFRAGGQRRHPEHQPERRRHRQQLLENTQHGSPSCRRFTSRRRRQDCDLRMWLEAFVFSFAGQTGNSAPVAWLAYCCHGRADSSADLKKMAGNVDRTRG